MKYNQHPNFIEQPKRRSSTLLLLGIVALGSYTATHIPLPSRSSHATISIPLEQRGDSTTQPEPMETMRINQLSQEGIAGWVMTPTGNIISYGRARMQATQRAISSTNESVLSSNPILSLISAQISQDGLRALVSTRNKGSEEYMSGPIENLKHNSEIGTSPSLSPDGTRVAFLTTNNEVTSIWITNTTPSNTSRRITDVRLQNLTLSWVTPSLLLLHSTNTQQSRDYLSVLNIQTGELTGLVSQEEHIEYNPIARNNTILVSWYSDSKPILAIADITSLKPLVRLPIATSAKKCGWTSDDTIICGVPRSGSLQSSLSAEMNSTRDDIIIVSLQNFAITHLATNDQAIPFNVLLPTGRARTTQYEIVFQNAFDQKLYTAIIPTPTTGVE